MAPNMAPDMVQIPSNYGDSRVDFTIRKARKSDIPDITRLNAQLGYPEPEPSVARRLRRILRDRRDHRIFVAVLGPFTARSDAAVVGWIHVFKDKLLTVGPLAEIGGLVVDDQCRSRGVGAALVLTAEQWSKQKGFPRVVVHTNVVRTRAHAFYEKCGYKLLKQSRVYTKKINSN
jgi:N-acetylglutamate synthase-like GNAT family acetyltransferase